MVPPIQEQLSMMDRTGPLTRFATLAALAAALSLAGCGRKGPLDLPPSAVAEPAAAASPSPTRSSSGVNPMAPHHASPRQEDSFTRTGEPVAPKGPKRPLPFDWLLD
jgi:predicted small lipoprotein YifL